MLGLWNLVWHTLKNAPWQLEKETPLHPVRLALLGTKGVIKINCEFQNANNPGRFFKIVTPEGLAAH